MHSIRSKILAITIAAILTSILSFLGTGYFNVKPESEHQSAEMMNLLSENTNQSLEAYFKSIEQSVEMAANIAMDSLDSVVLVEGGVAGTYAQQTEQTPEQAEMIDAYLAEHCQAVLNSFSSVSSRTQGIVTYYYCISPDISQNEHGFFYSRVGKTGFSEQPPLDARELDPNDIEHTTWYYTPIQRGRPSWIGPYKAHFLNEVLTMSYLVPIYKAGTFIGVLGMDILYDTVVEQISPIHFYRTGFACLLDEDGKVIYHPTIPLGSTPDYAAMSTPQEIFSKKTSGGELIRYSIGNEKRALAFSTLSNGMKLIVTAPLSEINASWNRLATIILLLSVAILSVFISVLTLVTNLITDPLIRLTKASQRLAAGDYDVELEYSRDDEVGTLTKAFSQMRDHLQEYISDLNRRVNTDDLTGLSNMNYFFRLAEPARQKMKEEGKHPVFLHFNLIGMKYFNRQFDFAEGDQLIRAIADILRENFGEANCSRFGFDHFSVLTDDENLEKRLNKVILKCMFANEGRSLPVRIGIYPDNFDDVKVNTACDRAKYASDRHSGSYESGFYYFDKTMLKQTENYRYIINNLDRALEEKWIKVHYQPIVRAVNGKVCDEEALSRWQDPEIGFLSPADFIPILEGSRLIYKLDLYVLEEILAKLKEQKKHGLDIVPQSINLSRLDFDTCDIVEEIRRRVDEAGISRDMLTIEVTESIVGEDFDFMKGEIQRFQALGFKVWMDDFGSGYSSLDVLQDIHFDLVKFDMRFMHRFSEGDESKIILSQLIKMAIGLGMDTLAEGVETAEQVEFLREVGCTKLQGFYYCKAIPLEEIIERNRKGIQIGFENPQETEYYRTLSRVNLYDLSAFAAEEDASFRHFFDTMPSALMEVQSDRIRFVRSNLAYREFMNRAYSFDAANSVYTEAAVLSNSNFMNYIRPCCETKKSVFFDEPLPDGSIGHIFLRYVDHNPVTGAYALAGTILSITEADQGASFSSIARALAADYFNLYYINLETEDYIAYSSEIGEDTLEMEQRGKNFFSESRKDALTRLYPADVKSFITAFTKENILKDLDEQGTFTLTYRLLIKGEPVYVNMKASRMNADHDHIIIGVSNIDSQMKAKEQLDRAKQEQTINQRIMAISEGYVCLYMVDPETGHYSEYSATSDYADFGISKTGEDFFRESIENGERIISSDDLPEYKKRFTRENVLEEIQRSGRFLMHYHLLLDGVPQKVILRAGLVRESDGAKLIVGVSKAES